MESIPKEHIGRKTLIVFQTADNFIQVSFAFVLFYKFL